jgi:hypothetical protein
MNRRPTCEERLSGVRAETSGRWRGARQESLQTIFCISAVHGGQMHRQSIDGVSHRSVEQGVIDPMLNEQWLRSVSGDAMEGASRWRIDR